MRNLKKLVFGLLLAGLPLLAATNPADPQTDQQLAQQITHQIRMYSNYSIFDDVNVRAQNGSVELFGSVSQPFKKGDLQRIAARTPGVATVTNDLKVLPLSGFDNRIRVQTARAIFRDPMLSRYAMQAVPPIHIIVDNGHVTLEGVVRTQMEKNVAGIRASGASLSFGPVVNNLRVEDPSPKRQS